MTCGVLAAAGTHFHMQPWPEARTIVGLFVGIFLLVQLILAIYNRLTAGQPMFTIHWPSKVCDPSAAKPPRTDGHTDRYSRYCYHDRTRHLHKAGQLNLCH